MPFRITVHEKERIIDVVYPAQPTVEEVTEYLARIRETIERMNGDWYALVDQGQLRAMTPEVVSQMARLNAYAQLHGMKRSARVVRDAAAGLQAWRMTKQAMLTIPTRTFESRGEALAWLKNGDAD